MDFKEKIDKILEIKGIKIWKLGDDANMRSTLEKAYKDNREMTDRKTENFLQNLGINKRWWETGEGEIFQEDIETDMHPNDRVPEEVYRNLVETNTEYMLVPKTILNEEYRILLSSEIEHRKKLLEEVIESKNNLIEQLKNEIKELRQSSITSKKT
jgi:hypothetical protein